MSLRRRSLLLLALLLGAASGGRDAAPRAAWAGEEQRDVSDLLAPLRERHDVPALAAAAIVGDRVVALGADGVRRRGSPERVAATDRFHLGSCTKAMTATLVALLVAEKRLAWEDTVAASFPGVEPVDPGWRKATLEQLLWHRAGAPANLDAGGLWGRLWRHPGPPVEMRKALVEGVLRAPPVSEPGTAMLYSNAGYAIAGARAEAVAKTPWEEAMRARLFGPLGMTSAGFGAPGNADAVDQPRGHRDDGTPVEPGPGSDNPAAIGPGGTVHASLEDWAKFAALHLRGEDRGGLGLGKEAFRRLHAPPPGGDYAMGWAVTQRPWGGRVLTHAGSNTMWYAVVWLAPEKGFAVMAACNQAGERGPKACDDAVGALIRVVAGR